MCGKELAVKQNSPDVAAHTAGILQSSCAQNQARHQESRCRTPNTRCGPPSTHCAVTYLSNVPAPFFLLERVRSMLGFCSIAGLGACLLQSSLPSLQPAQTRALRQAVHARNLQNHLSSLSCQSRRESS